MTWWDWGVLAWAAVATVAVAVLSVALYRRAAQVRALTNDDWPAPSRPVFAAVERPLVDGVP